MTSFCFVDSKAVGKTGSFSTMAGKLAREGDVLDAVGGLVVGLEAPSLTELDNLEELMVGDPGFKKRIPLEAGIRNERGGRRFTIGTMSREEDQHVRNFKLFENEFIEGADLLAVLTDELIAMRQHGKAAPFDTGGEAEMTNDDLHDSSRTAALGDKLSQAVV